MENISIKGVKVSCSSSRHELISYVASEKKRLIAINAEKILHSTEQIRSLINQNIGYADGIGAVWALKKKGLKNAIKIPGCELWLNIVLHFYKSKSFYFVGSKEEVINQTIINLKIEFPEINILGFRNSYIKTEEEKQKFLEDIALKKPDIVFVAMGSPKQEMRQLHPTIYQGFGGSFDVYAGAIQRVPQ